MQLEQKQGRRVGRPKAAEGTRKIYNLTVRLSDADLMELADKASRAGLSFSRFMREAGLGRELPRPVPVINLQTYQELGRIGANINQITRRIYEGYFDGNSIVVEVLEELTRIVQAIRKELRGQ